MPIELLLVDVGFSVYMYECIKIVYTVEPCLSDPRLFVPLIIQNDLWKFLKQVMPDSCTSDPLFVV